MGRRGAKALHLALFLLGVALYVVFVLPRWWVLTGSIPSTLATVGRIATAVSIGAAALPVMWMLQAGLRSKPRIPELALRLRAWSGILHVTAGALILLTAIVEIWLSLEAGGPWLFAVYGAAAAIAILGCLALYLSFIAELPPAEAKQPRAAKVKKPKKTKSLASDKRPNTKLGRKKKTRRIPEVPEVPDVSAEAIEATDDDAVAATADTTAVIISSSSDDTVADVTTADTAQVIEAASPAVAVQTAGLRNRRPSGKNRHRLPR